jgi:integrase
MRATDGDGQPTFPVLHRRDENGRRVPVPSGVLPSFHGFRHMAASEAIAAGESAEEVSWQLGHQNTVITRAVYVQEVKSAERTRADGGALSMLEAAVEAPVEATDGSGTQPTSDTPHQK